MLDLLDSVWRFDAQTGTHMPNTLYVNSAIQYNSYYISFLHVFAIFVCSFLTSIFNPYFRNRVWGPKFDLALLTLKDDQVPVIPKQLGPLKKRYGLDCIGFKADCAIPKTFFIHFIQTEVARDTATPDKWR